MKQPEEEPIVYKVQLLEELVARQNETLELANEIIANKTRLIELCELQVNLYKKENKHLRRVLLICGVLFASLGIINVIRLLA